MELKLKPELRHILAPQLQQSLKVLALPLLDLKLLVTEEMQSNPVLEEEQPALSKETVESLIDPFSPADAIRVSPSHVRQDDSRENYSQCFIRKPSLQDILLRQLGISSRTDDELRIGQEIIGNIDENGYLKATVAEIAAGTAASPDAVEHVLSMIQKFEPAGVCARSVAECLLIQLRNCNESDSLLPKIIEFHLEDVARRNYSKIAKALNAADADIEAAIGKITSLNPKPGRNFSVDDIRRIIPDITIDADDEGNLSIATNADELPRLMISERYKAMLRTQKLDEQTKMFLMDKLKRAVELVRAVSRRQSTLRRVAEAIAEIQETAILEGPSLLKPLTFRQVAEKLDLHESTVCRVVMNKHCQTPCGIMALKDFFPSGIATADKAGEMVSSRHIKSLISGLIGQENKKKPLSDEELCALLHKNHNVVIARRTVAKYREEIKILSSPYRRIK